MELSYGIVLWHHITDSYYGIRLRNHLYEKDPEEAWEVLGASGIPGTLGPPGTPLGPQDNPGTPRGRP